jgi:nitroreductase
VPLRGDPGAVAAVAAVHELIQARRSRRCFSEEPVEPALLRCLLEAARWAPSSYNEQPWAFIVSERGDAAFADLLGCLSLNNQAWAAASAVLVLTAAKLTLDRNGKPNRHAYHDVGVASAQLTLQATALGLHACQIAGFDPALARARLGVPEGFDPVSVIALGHPGCADALPEAVRVKEEAPRQRKPLGAFVHGGCWGRTPSFLD